LLPRPYVSIPFYPVGLQRIGDKSIRCEENRPHRGIITPHPQIYQPGPVYLLDS
jgi:hypothetical protein